jgi:acetolactate synthase I/II/III large subunit
MLTQLVTEYNVPFFTTQMGKGVVDESLPQFAGTAALSSNDAVHDTVSKSDLVLMVGHDIVEKPPFFVGKNQKIIHINFASASVNDIYYPDIEVVGDIANAIWQIKDSLGTLESKPNWETNYHATAKQKLDAEFASKVQKATTITPQVVVSKIRKHLPKTGICALDNGMFKIWFARHFVTHQENTLLPWVPACHQQSRLNSSTRSVML